MKARRSSKEPVLSPESALAPVVAQLKSHVLGLRASVMPDADAETRAHVEGKAEGMEAAVLLIQRAGAKGVVTPEGQHLVQVTRSGEGALEARVAKLEREMRELRGGALPSHISSSTRMPAILKTPAPRPKGDSKLGRCERALLAVLAQRRNTITTAEQLAVLSGYSVRSSSFANALGKIRTAGLCEGMRDGLHSTPEGLKAAGETPPILRGAALVDRWCLSLGRAEEAMLRALVQCHPRALDREALAEATGYSLTSSSFANAIGKLRNLKLVDAGWPARAAKVLFEGGMT